MKHQNEDILDETLKGLKREAPPSDFRIKVLHQVRMETGMLRKRRDYLPVIPKILMAGFALILISFFYLLAQHHRSIQLHLENQLLTVFTVTLILVFIWLCFIGTDWMIRKIAI